MQLLLRFGADPHQRRRSPRAELSLLHLVIAGSLQRSSDTSCLEVVRQLLHVEVDLNVVHYEGWTPLYVATSWELYYVAQELIFHGTLDWAAETSTGEVAAELSTDTEVIEEVRHNCAHDDFIISRTYHIQPCQYLKIDISNHCFR